MLSHLPQSFVAFATAFVLGTLIGAERQWRQRSAGLRTTVLVALGAAAFADLGIQLAGPEGSTRIVAYIVSGIGFLGAGVILKDGANIRGLNTAGTLWCSAAVGAFSGCGYPGQATLLTFFVLAGNTLLRPLVNYINRRPVDETSTEAQYTVHATCAPEDVPDVRDLLFDKLEAAHYPVREVAVLTESDDLVELGATLVASSAAAGELDQVVTTLEKSPAVKTATWTASTVT
ncbi:MgtC/SapB family protein [Acidocella aromatica]|uniref:Protein MgtC n=1 Tax=Acidocella aromatica TaxID=1303579 RepID=A0A840VRY5_9PROT|nr:MgtC/SapB family protein [Acidocella aromatica]MBB5373022.1 putative Mg2+ transporter-C (MgtC) family protein [Acidocella aromatica]